MNQVQGNIIQCDKVIKDKYPLHIMFYQSDIEKIMFTLNEVLLEINNCRIHRNIEQIKNDLQHKIDWHKENGEWV